MNLNPQQQRAVDSTAHNIIVSAGAGSGKTEVLRQRVNRLLKQGIKLDQIVLITFTKASAKEMKERILSLNPDLAGEVANASITTFDAFFLDFVRKFGHLIGIDNDVRIIDDTVLREQIKKIIIQLANTIIKHPDNLYYDFLMLQFDNKNAMVNTICDWYISYTNNIERDTQLNYHDALDILHQHYNERKNKLLNELIHAIKYFCYDAKLKDREECLQQCEQMLGIDVLDLTTMRASRQTLTKKIKSVLKHLDDDLQKEYMQYATELENLLNLRQGDTNGLDANMYNATSNVYEKYYSVIEDIIAYIDQEITAYKQAENAFNYNDITDLTYKILESNFNEVNDYLNNIVEIMVDEFQDTSRIQNKILSKLQTKNTTLFLVGDSKQSIYGFRYSSPEYFNEKIEKFSKDNDDSEVIYLNQNYRSHQILLEQINQLFSSIMRIDQGNIDYQSMHQLEPGRDQYPSLPTNLLGIKYITYDTSYVKEIASQVTRFGKIDSLKYQSLQIIKYIKELVKDPNTTYGDICILSNKKSSFKYLNDLCHTHNIPISIQTDQNINEKDVFEVVKNILNILAGNDLEYNYYAILRSFLYQVSDQDLQPIFIDHKHVLDNLKNSEYKEILDTIDQLLIISKQCNLTFLMEQIFYQFPFAQQISSLSSDSWYETIYFKLIELFQAYDQGTYNLDDVIEQINDSNNIDLLVKKDIMQPHSVQAMTIHKSKGLQFKHVILMNLSSKSKEIKVHDYSRKYGFLLKIRETINGHIINYKNRLALLAKEEERDIHEEVRIFYVACTRAQDTLTIFGHEGEKVIDVIKNHHFPLIECQLTVDEIIEYLGIQQHKQTSQKKPEAKIVQNYHELAYTTKQRASRNDVSILAEQQDVIKLGDYYHRFLSSIDLLDIKNLKLNDKDLQHILDLMSKSIIFSNIKEYYTEVEFYDDKQQIHGIIDLIIKTNDEEYYIVDYKLNDINKQVYDRQLRIYYDFLKSKIQAPISCYLYSLVTGKYRKVEIKS